jgi:iron(III) transport system substrate-binding protein
VVNSSDASHFIIWKRQQMLAAYVPEDVAQHYPPEHRDPDGLFASYRVYLCCMGYNTSLVKPEDAPQSFADLLDPKWKSKIVKAHPGYSGTILTATYQTARDVGWGYFEKLAQQNVLQVQSASDPPKKLALGERAIMADGIEYGVFQAKEKGQPVETLYPKEGTPLIIGPNGVLKTAPNPNAARLLQSFMLSAECQQFNVEFGGLRTAHALVKDKPGRKPMKDIKVMKDDAAAVEKQSAEIKAHYTRIFKV